MLRGDTTTGSCWPCSGIEDVALKDLRRGRSLSARLTHKLLQTWGNTWLLLISFVGRMLAWQLLPRLLWRAIGLMNDRWIIVTAAGNTGVNILLKRQLLRSTLLTGWLWPLSKLISGCGLRRSSTNLKTLVILWLLRLLECFLLVLLDMNI